MVDEFPKRRLGRGLAALIGEMETPVAPGAADKPAISPDRTVPLAFVRPNSFNPRREFDEDELADLAQSIARHGIVQPILVRPLPESAGVRYEIIAGERRWRAAQRAGLHEIPVIIRDAEDRLALELAIIENVQRADLNALEEALGYQRLIEEYGYSHGELGETLGRSRSHVANMIRLLKLPASVQSMLRAGELSAGHARALLTAERPEDLARRIVEEGLSVRQAEALGRPAMKASRAARPAAAKGKSADLQALEKQLTDHLGLQIGISHRPDGSGVVRINYADLEQLDAVCSRLTGERT